MPSVALQVEVHAPPGLENGSGCRPLQPAGVAPVRPTSEQVMKEDLIREVTTAVREHIDWKTAAAVDTLWQKGQKAMQQMQLQQQGQTEALQGQLMACTESYHNLERENAVLRTNLEALMKHITLLVGPPTPVAATPPPLSHVVVPGPSPFFPWSASSGPTQSTVLKAAAKDPREAAASPRDPEFQPGPVSDTPLGPIRRSPVEPASTTSSSMSGSTAAQSISGTENGSCGEPENCEKPVQGPCVARAAADEASGASEPARRDWVAISRPQKANEEKASETSTFSLTLRRADTVPLGLDVTGETGGECLTVQAVRPGGAVEAWNRQCPGELREIRAGDRIVCINDMEDANAMREECLTKHLLKMTVIRQTPSQPCPAALQGLLRADAHEFVPQVPATC